MDEKRLAEIEARANAATPGPWVPRPSGREVRAMSPEALIHLAIPRVRMRDRGPGLPPMPYSTPAELRRQARMHLDLVLDAEMEGLPTRAATYLADANRLEDSADEAEAWLTARTGLESVFRLVEPPARLW